ncbi:LuxR C-terminal-related transcriptional regulator [Enterobacter asburiae]|uniref:helix-turn-helix transcriptional regulator n=1 Tax=Enterobacter asburiae TaxID=61645 RepID=UPI002965DF2A|nr:LuxR C-terminal-related transcriptional regulator [Enterobacter asburiae]MDW3570462.1 LuxR C-terminal-related transcriptional regulator [Enterobacter asburiae]
MFTFTVCSRVVHPTLLNGFVSSLKAFREQNPEWNYELTRHDNTRLTLLDFTAYDTLTDVSAAEYEDLCRQGEGTALVMLTACQEKLAHQLMRSYRCSLLCVDERLLELRELIKYSMKKQRYISAHFLRLREQDNNITDGMIFTDAEKKVLSGLKNGKTGIELSREMFRSQKTISTHKRKIMLKLGVKNDLQLRKAIQKLQPPQ